MELKLFKAGGLYFFVLNEVRFLGYHVDLVKEMKAGVTGKGNMNSTSEICCHDFSFFHLT
jgi:hypothetical protein